jgi:hypothetical protein
VAVCQLSNLEKAKARSRGLAPRITIIQYTSPRLISPHPCITSLMKQPSSCSPYAPQTCPWWPKINEIRLAPARQCMAHVHVYIYLFFSRQETISVVRAAVRETVRKRNSLSRVVIYFLMYREKKKKKTRGRFYSAPWNVWNINFPLSRGPEAQVFLEKLSVLSARVTCIRGKVIVRRYIRLPVFSAVYFILYFFRTSYTVRLLFHSQ